MIRFQLLPNGFYLARCMSSGLQGVYNPDGSRRSGGFPEMDEAAKQELSA